MDNSLNQEQALFEEAIKIASEAERAAFLDVACQNDPRLRNRLEALLQGHLQAEGFLQTPPADESVIIPAIIEGLPVAEKPGDLIGRYKLLEKIGEGGFGTVYMAEQKEPIKRRVAFKVIKLGMDTKQVVARFEVERQALALLDHPNIAKVIDAGATETGRPYFVMELIRGVPITQYCDENNLPAFERLALFTQVCHAIQHAHQKGIIHRDIKPSNVLVMLHDGVPMPKVIDFGVAKATQQELTEKTLFTQFQQFIGTPAYMSPEQAGQSGLDIDTRSDIYALGVLLYELLTGRTPFDPKSLVSAGLDEMRRIIREEEPVRPSARLSTLAEAERTAVAHQRESEALRLIHLLRGDLDWIVMKCLEKDRTRRYETANGLAADIARHLHSEPVMARPPGAAYRTRKFIRRNKVMVTAVAAIALTLFSGAILSTWQAMRARRAEDQALRALKREEAERQKAEKAQAEEARQRGLVETTSAQLAQNLNRMELEKAEELFAASDSATALAHLAQVMRRDPTDRVAAERFLNQLIQLAVPQTPMFELPHNGAVQCVEFSPDGKTLLTAAISIYNGTVRLWDVETGKPLTPPAEHEGKVVAAQFTAEGPRFVVRYPSLTVESNGVTTNLAGVPLVPSGPVISFAGVTEKISTVTNANGELSPSFATSFTSPGTTVRLPENVIRVWDALSGKPVGPPIAHEELWSYRWSWGSLSPNGRYLVTPFGDRAARIINAESGTMVADLLRHPSRVDYATFTPDGSRVLTVCQQRLLRVWEVATGKLLTETTNAFVIPFSGTALNISGNVLRAATTSGVWDLCTGVQVTRLAETAEDTTTMGPSMPFSQIHFSDFSPDGYRLVTGSFGGSVRIWDAVTGQAVGRLMKHTDVVNFAKFSPDGSRVASASRDGTARVWDANTGRPLTESLRHDAQVNVIAFSPDGRSVVTGSEDKMARIWQVPPAPGPFQNKLIMVDSQGRVASQTFDLPWASWLAVPSHSMPAEQVLFSRFSPDRKQVLVISQLRVGSEAGQSQRGQPKIVRLARVGENQPPIELARSTHIDAYGAFSPDGRRLIAPGLDPKETYLETIDGKLVKAASVPPTLFDASNGKPLAPLYSRGPKNPEINVTFTKFSPDGRRAIVISGGHPIVWNTELTESPAVHLENARSANYAEFSPDGRVVVTAGSYSDWAARIWDASSGKLACQPLKHRNLVKTASFSPDGKWIITGSDDRTAQIWEVATGKPRNGALKHDEPVCFAQFSPDGLRVATATRHGTIRIWDAQTGKPLVGPISHQTAADFVRFTPDSQWVTATVRGWNSWDEERVQTWSRADAIPVIGRLGNDEAGESARFSLTGRWLLCGYGAVESVTVSEAAQASMPVPSWVPNFAEAVAGKRVTGTGTYEPLQLGELARFRVPGANTGSPDVYTRYANWFLADPERRSVTPSSPLSLREYVEDLMSENSPAGLREAARVAPGNALALARWAAVMVKMPQWMEQPRARAEADFCSRRATELAPSNPEVLQIRSNILSQLRANKPAAETVPSAQPTKPSEP